MKILFTITFLLLMTNSFSQETLLFNYMSVDDGKSVSTEAVISFFFDEKIVTVIPEKYKGTMVYKLTKFETKDEYYEFTLKNIRTK